MHHAMRRAVRSRRRKIEMEMLTRSNCKRLSETLRRSLLCSGQPFDQCSCAFHLAQTSCHAANSDGLI